MCNNCIHKDVCSIYDATGGVNKCEHHREERRGVWKYYSTTMQECSNCHRHTARHKFKYCPHCGAVMEDRYNEG